MVGKDIKKIPPSLNPDSMFCPQLGTANKQRTNQPLFARKFRRLTGQRTVFARGPLIHLIIITGNLFDYVMFIWEIFNLLAYYCLANP